MVPDSVIEEGISGSFRGFSAGFRVVTRVLHRCFRGFQRGSGSLHRIRGGFRRISKAFQEASEDIRRVSET